jgi:predicted amidohydrolase YtcJ
MRKKCNLFLFVLLFPAVIWGQSIADIAAMLGHPQTIVYNAKIITVDDGGFTSELGTIGQAMAIRDKKVLAVGSNSDIRALAGPDTTLIDLKGRTVVPGMIMTHNHPIDWAPVVPQIVNSVASPDIATVRAIFGQPLEQFAKFPEVLEEAVRVAKPGSWIQILFVWDINVKSDDPDIWWVGKHITKEQLDRLAPNNPLIVRSREAILRQGREEMLNQRAVEVLREVATGPNAVMPDREAGIARALDAAEIDGIPAGSVRRWMWPEVILKDRLDLWEKMLQLDNQWWTAKGQTTWASFLYHYPNNIKAYRNLDRRGEMDSRVAWGWGAIPAEAEKRDFQDPFLVADLATREGTGTDSLWYIGTGLGNVDGGGSCTTAQPRATVTPEDIRAVQLPPPGSCSGPFQPDTPAWEFVKQGGRYMAGHQWGDVSIDLITSMIMNASKAGGLTMEEIRSKHHVADHMFGWPRPDQIPILKELGMYVGGSDMYVYDKSRVWMENYGESTLDYIVPRASLVAAGIYQGTEVDKPIELTDTNLFLQLYWVITRKAEDGKVYSPKEKISREIALKVATTWASHYVLKEDVMGSLERGKFADYLVLDRDYLTIPEEEIPDVRVLMAVVGNKVTHLVPSLADELGMEPAGAAVLLGGAEASY